MFTTLAFHSPAHAAPDSDAGKWFNAEKPIADTQGRIRYIVILEANNSAKPKSKHKDAKAAIDWKVSVTNHYINAVIKSSSSQIQVLSATGLVVPSFVAYLTETQAKDLAADKRVLSLTEDRHLKTSTTWTNTLEPRGQTRSRGLKAMYNNADPTPFNGNATVYVIDTGVELHADLPSMYGGNQFNGNDMMYGLVTSGTVLQWVVGLTPRTSLALLLRKTIPLER